MDRFEKFGEFNVIHALSQSYHTTPEQAERISLGYAILSMQYATAQADYNEALSNFHKQK